MNLAVCADNNFSRWSLFGHPSGVALGPEEVIARVGVRARGPGQVATSLRRQPAEGRHR